MSVQAPAPPTLLVIDHFDSFTFNLVQLARGLVRARGGRDEDVLVLRSGARPLDALLALRPRAVLLSPGPGVPRDEADSLALVDALPRETPLFGVCLGMQIVAEAFGAAVVRAPRVMHGRTSTLRHDGQGCFAGLPERLEVMRYHSWSVDAASLPPELEATAFADDGTLMALRHRARPIEALQFHPESFLTEHGARMLAPLIDRALARR